MKKLLLLLMFMTPVFAQQQDIEILEYNQTLKCAKTEDIMRFINENFGETMSWVGKDENSASYLSLYKNKDTGTWSLIQYDSRIGCFIGSGSQGSPV